VLAGELDRLPAPLLGERNTPMGRQFRPVRQAGELEVGAPDPARQGDALLQMPGRVVGLEGVYLGDAEAYQCQRAQVITQPELGSVRVIDRSQQLVRLLGHGRQVTALPGQGQPRDGGHDPETPAAVCGDRAGPLRGERELPLCLRQRSPGQLTGRHQHGELRVGRDGTGGKPGQQLMCGGGLPVQVQGEPVVRQQPGGQAPVSRRLGVPDRLHRETVSREPAGRRLVQAGKLTRFAAP
jgi:hypothetical protein